MFDIAEVRALLREAIKEAHDIMYSRGYLDDCDISTIIDEILDE